VLSHAVPESLHLPLLPLPVVLRHVDGHIVLAYSALVHLLPHLVYRFTVRHFDAAGAAKRYGSTVLIDLICKYSTE
jgi:hypothetical protein